jgi:hypothetical protein
LEEAVAREVARDLVNIAASAACREYRFNGIERQL